LAFGACCPQGVLLTDGPLLLALGMARRAAEPLSPVLTVYSLVPRADVSPPLAGAARLAGLDVAAALVWLAALGPAVWGVARSRS
jgi:hypothetical protein